MPIVPKVAADGDRVGEIQRAHSSRRPDIHQVRVHAVRSLLVPDRSQMRSVIVGGIAVVGELKF